MDRRDEQDKRRKEEYEKHPMIKFSDSINRSMTGDLGELTKGSCLTKIITTIIVIGLIILIIFLFR